MSGKSEYRVIQPTGWTEPGLVRLIVEAKGYAMVRRKGCAPFVITSKEWADASPQTDGVVS